MNLLFVLPSLLEGSKVAFSPNKLREKPDQWRQVTWLLIGVGIFLRLFHFLDNRSLWLDEIYLSNSLVKMNFWELAAPMLEYEQKAPLIFLWLVRVFVLVFGKNEMALRLFPLLCGIGSLFLFLPVARYFLKPTGVVVAMGIMALAPPLIFHAVEIKQYSTELLATVTILYLYIRFHHRANVKYLVFWGLAGAILIWFSFSSIFILAGIAIGTSLHYFFKKDWASLVRGFIPFGLWLIVFSIQFILFTGKHIRSEWLLDWFENQEAFMPILPRTAKDIMWFFQMPYRLMNYPLGLLWFSSDISYNILGRMVFRMLPLFLLVLALGIYGFQKKSKKAFLILICPLLLTLLASGLKVYPFYERLIVFLAPIIILFMAEGNEKLTHFFPAKFKLRVVLPALLLAAPLTNSLLHVYNPQLMDNKQSKGMAIQHHREAFLYINQRYQPGDAVYVYWNDLPPYRFYKNLLPLKFKAIEGRDVRFISKNKTDYFKNLAPDFNAFLGKKRVWLVYDRLLYLNIGDFVGRPAWYYKANNVQPGKLQIHEKFAELGKETDSYLTPYLSVSLFEINAN